MKRVIHECLDGEHAHGELEPEASRELAELHATIGTVVDAIHAAPVPDLTARVMATVAELPASAPRRAGVAAALRRALDWLWTPRPVTIRLRPVHAFGALGVVSLVPVLARVAVSTGPLVDGQVAAAEAAAPQVYVQFRIEAEGASHVALAGSFTDWEPVYELKEAAPGSWSILVPLPPGIHDYAFLVDGEEWVADPHAFQVDDGFGGLNSRIALPTSTGDYRQS